METTRRPEKGEQILIKKWTREDGKVFEAGRRITVDRDKEKKLIQQGYLADPQKKVKIIVKPKKLK